MSNIRISLTGGGTGGHIFPLAAVADALLAIGRGAIELRYYGPESEWNSALTAREIPIVNIAGAKLRRYASIQNIFDVPKFFFGIFQALVKLYLWMPDAVFSKGGPGALPVVLAAAWYRIPVIIHESDAVPGLTNRISAKFAKRIGISFHGAAIYFPERKAFFSGNPVRAEFSSVRIEKRAAKSRLGFDPDTPLLLVLGGSQGAKVLNEFVENALPMLTPFTEVYHQLGKGNAAERAMPRYRAAEYVEEAEMATALRAADLVLTRAGAGAIYECAAVGAPAILVPLPHGANDHQRANAAEYAASGAALVLEENNLTPNLAAGEIKKLLGDGEKLRIMGERARDFFRSDAVDVIAREIIGVTGAKVV